VAFHDEEDNSGALSAAKLPVTFREELRAMASIGTVFTATQRILEGNRSNAAGIVVLVMDMKGYADADGDEFTMLPFGDSLETQDVPFFDDLHDLAKIYVNNLRYWNTKRLTLLRSNYTRTQLFRAENFWKCTIQLVTMVRGVAMLVDARTARIGFNPETNHHYLRETYPRAKRCKLLKPSSRGMQQLISFRRTHTTTTVCPSTNTLSQKSMRTYFHQATGRMQRHYSYGRNTRYLRAEEFITRKFFH
jgi:hypothetical protein